MNELDAIQSLVPNQSESIDLINLIEQPVVSCIKQADSLEDLADYLKILIATGIQNPQLQQIQQMIHSGSSLTEIKETFAIN